MDFVWYDSIVWLIVFPAILVVALLVFRPIYQRYAKHVRKRMGDEALERMSDQEATTLEESGPMARDGWAWHVIKGVRQYSKKNGNGWLWVELVEGKPSGKYAIHGLKVGDKEYKPIIVSENHVAAAKMAMELDRRIAAGWVPDSLK